MAHEISDDDEHLIFETITDLDWDLHLAKVQIDELTKERDQAQRRTDALVRLVRALANLMGNVADTVDES
jgi:hypothetical protein